MAELARAKPEVVNGKLRMLGDRLLLIPLDWQPSRVIEISTQRRAFSGKVVAVGPGKYPKRRRATHDPRKQVMTLRSRFQPTEVRVGDVVELGGLNVFDGQGYQWVEVIVDGVRHIIVSEQDVCGIREPELSDSANVRLVSRDEMLARYPVPGDER